MRLYKACISLYKSVEVCTCVYKPVEVCTKYVSARAYAFNFLTRHSLSCLAVVVTGSALAVLFTFWCLLLSLAAIAMVMLQGKFQTQDYYTV